MRLYLEFQTLNILFSAVLNLLGLCTYSSDNREDLDTKVFASFSTTLIGSKVMRPEDA